MSRRTFGTMRWSLLVAAVPFVFSLSSPNAASQGAGPESSINFGSLDRVAEAELNATSTPGAAIAVVVRDRVVFARGFGVASVETKAPVSPDMLFRIGSTTKMLTAVAVLGLAEEGKINLQSPVGTYLKDLHPSLARLTADQLLTHTAGIRDEAILNGPHDDAALGANIRTLNASNLFAEPGTVYSYANPGYWILGYLAEVVDGKPYAEVMLDRVFRALGMNRTTLRPTMAMTFPLAQGHDNASTGAPIVIRPAPDNAANWPAGSVFSSVLDMSRFVIAFMNGGVLDGKTTLPPSIVASLATPRVPEPSSDGSRYAYGLSVVSRDGLLMLEHSGSRAGYGSLIRIIPERRLGIIVFNNRTGFQLRETADKALELAFGRVIATNADRPRPVPVSAMDMTALVGSYSQSSFTGSFEVVGKGNQLFIRDGKAELPLTKLGDNWFVVDLPNAEPQDIFFILGSDGKASYLHGRGRALPRVVR